MLLGFVAEKIEDPVVLIGNSVGSLAALMVR